MDPRARLIEAPGQPGYEELADMTPAERRKLPPAYHIPAWVPYERDPQWVCSVCSGERAPILWPCSVACCHGGEVFTTESPSDTEEAAYRRGAGEMRRRIRDMMLDHNPLAMMFDPVYAAIEQMPTSPADEAPGATVQYVLDDEA